MIVLLLSLFSSCFTHRKKISPILHAIHAYYYFYLSIYLFISLFHSHCTTNLASDQPSTNFSFTYQPNPHVSVRQCLDSVPFTFFCKARHLSSLALCSRRHKAFLFSLLLLLA